MSDPTPNDESPFAPLAAPRQRDEEPPSEWRAAGLLFVLVLATYSPLWKSGYIWDDDDYVTRNVTLRTVDGLRRIWCEIGAVPQYYPLVHTTFWAEYHLWKLAPLGYHLVNIGLHTLCAILAWRLLARLQVPGAWLAAAVFAVHPVEVESTAWITERKNVLSMALALSSMLAYLRFSPTLAGLDNDLTSQTGQQRGVHWGWWLLAFVLFAAALLSKTVVASLPAVLLVIAWWRGGRVPWRDVWPLLPFFALGVGMGLLTAWMEKHHVGASGKEWDFSFADRLLIAGRAVWFYAGKLAWPYPLVFFYPRWEIDDHSAWQCLFPVAAVALVASLWLLRGRCGRGPLAAVLIFGGVLFPALGFLNVFPMRFSFVADHFQYHASLALIALAVAGLVAFAGKLPAAWQGRTKMAALLTIIMLAIVACQRTRIFANPETLYLDTITRNPGCSAAYVNLTTYLEARGRFDEALATMQAAVPRFPEDADVHNNYAAVLLRVGQREGFTPARVDELLANLETALRLQPDRISTRNNLAFALDTVGRANEAVQRFNEVLDLAPDNAEALYGLGTLAARQNKVSDAESYFTRALEQNPSLAPAHYALAGILLGQERSFDAMSHLDDALRIDPNFAEAHLTLGDVLRERGQLKEAVQHYHAALLIRPGLNQAVNNLGVALLKLGQTDQAIRAFQEALRRQPGNVEAQTNLQTAERVKQQGGTRRSSP